MTQASYPRGKVFMAFLLCPLIPGFIAGLVNSGLLVAHLATHPRLIGEVRGVAFNAPFHYRHRLGGRGLGRSWLGRRWLASEGVRASSLASRLRPWRSLRVGQC